jgi:hypothetical protein
MPTAGEARAHANPRRQKRDARLIMRATPSLKAKLQKVADSEYRTLTDFLEM